MDEHAVVAAVLVGSGHVLLCHRSPTRNWYPNVWDVPGGHIKAHELPEEALRRELIEELGIDVGQVTEPPACSTTPTLQSSSPSGCSRRGRSRYR